MSVELFHDMLHLPKDDKILDVITSQQLGPAKIQILIGGQSSTLPIVEGLGPVKHMNIILQRDPLTKDVSFVRYDTV
jgi:hypothetical protein